VLGLINQEDIGITLSHEHCLVDVTCGFNNPKEASRKKIANEKVNIENVGYIRYHMLDNFDNLLLLDEDLAIKELLNFKYYGGKTIIDATSIGIGRDPIALRKISLATGLNIVMGSGYYVEESIDKKKIDKMTENDIAKEIIDEIFNGVGDANICPGIIGEIGCSYPLKDSEKKILRGAGIAQKQTGAPLVVHPGRFEEAPFEIIKILKEVGADLTHTSICHIDRTIFEPQNRYKIADLGCYLQYDIWGQEGYYPVSGIDILNDIQRISHIKNLVQCGYQKQILISHDICQKCRYRAYGGHGYNHILSNAIPAMKSRGLDNDVIQDLIINNPKNFFVFR
jgi:phosphotriesterase-related protein